MGLLSKIGLGAEPSLEEQNKRRDVRQSFLDFLASEQGRALQSQKDGKLSPESTQTVLQRVKKSQDWLTNNPNANLSEIQTERDSFTVDVKKVYDVNSIKQQLGNTPIFLQLVYKWFNREENRKRLSKEDVAKLQTLPAVGSTLNYWFKKHQDESLITYQQKLEEVKNQLIFQDKSINHEINGTINSLATTKKSDLESFARQQDIRIANSERADFNTSTVVGQTTATATQIVVSLGLITLCLFCGSLAANQAIGRDEVYRTIYFIWGAIPVFAPLVAFYSILKRFREGPLPMYSVLPLSTTEATTRLGKLLNYPFFWTPDAQSDAMRKAYLDSLSSVASY